ncbi:hypothetical protein GQQ20_19330 [Pantoea agglomerans]|nr:hypothetical protein [Pantoea agglomerans]NEH00801.1 hypothetical protein [Pantoea agglomerans]NEH01440.1 hypothetical protein [Pantoea agglomerans]NEH16307.1 hypothetical protein [Pantoea agglomerans]
MKEIALTEGLEIRHIRSRLAGPGRGTCEVCGEEIPAARRMLVSCAVTCVTCQEIREFRRKTGMP